MKTLGAMFWIMKHLQCKNNYYKSQNKVGHNNTDFTICTIFDSLMPLSVSSTIVFKNIKQ